MKDIFYSGYHVFYRVIISTIWALAIILAIAQSEYFSKALAYFIASSVGAEIKGVHGSIFSEITIDGLKYEGLDVAMLTVNPSAIFYTHGVFRFNYILALGVQTNQKWLDGQLNSKGKTPEWLKGVEIKRAKLGLKNFIYDDFNVSDLKLDAKNFTTNLKTIKLEFSAKGESNVVNFNADGKFADGNYSAKGFISGVSKGYVDKQADDVDFNFGALKQTPFYLYGNDKTLKVVADIENSDIFYKFDINAKIIKARVEMDMNLSAYNFTLHTLGKLSSKYAIADADFTVEYDGFVKYGGEAQVLEISYVPLSVFKPFVKIDKPKITYARFDGNASALRVEAKGLASAVITDDEPVGINNLDAFVDYVFKTKSLKVVANAQTQTQYGALDANVTVSQENLGTVKFAGNAYAPKISGIAAKDYSADATFSGDDNNLKVFAKLDDGGVINVSSNGYKNFNFDFKNSSLNLQDFFALAPKYKGSFANVDVSGVYNNPDKKWSINGKIVDGKILNKKLIAKDIKLTILQNQAITLEPTKIEIGKTTVLMSATKVGQNDFNATVKANGALLNAVGSLRPLNLNLDLEMANLEVAKKDFGDFIYLEKEQIFGALSVKSHIYKDGNVTSFDADAHSTKLSFAGVEVANFDAKLLYDTHGLFVKNFQTTIFGKNITAISLEPILFRDNGKVDMGIIDVNEGKIKISGWGSIKEKSLDLKILANNYKFFDPKYAKSDIDGYVNVSLRQNKMYVSGDLLASNLEILYKPPTFSIPHDKDIIVLKDAKSPLVRSWFANNCDIDVNVSTKTKAKYAMKDGNVTLSIAGKVTKELEKKLGFNGKIDVGGDYYAVGKIFKITKGALYIKYGEEENPFLNLQLEYDNSKDNVIIYVFVTGHEKNPNVTFASNPAMSERDMLSYLAFGVSSNQNFAKQGSQAQDSAQAIVMLSSYLSRNILGELGAKINTVNVSQSNYQVGTSKIEVGASLTKDISIIYQQDVNSRVGIKYDFSHNFGVQMTSGQNGSSVEMTYSQDY